LAAGPDGLTELGVVGHRERQDQHQGDPIGDPCSDAFRSAEAGDDEGTGEGCRDPESDAHGKIGAFTEPAQAIVDINQSAAEEQQEHAGGKGQRRFFGAAEEEKQETLEAKDCTDNGEHGEDDQPGGYPVQVSRYR
jgi:hypothetical protein